LAGIVATTIVTGIGYLFRFFIVVRIGHYLIEKVLICFPQHRNISGTWETEFWKDDRSYNEIARISQFFRTVWGVIEFNKQGQLRKYRMAGRIRENVVSATYEIVSPTEPLDRGSFTLALSQDGVKLQGCYAWTDDESPVPQGNKYVWIKPGHLSTDGIQIRRSSVHGKGVFANKEYPEGCEVAYFRGYEVYKDTRSSLTLEGRKIEPTGPLKYLNHSCNPNCYFRGRTLVTKRRVLPGEELNVDYLASEESLRYPFKCKCQNAECKKTIRQRM
jgi:hypothetical protein